MKKNFKILSAAILAVSMLFAVSCKKDAEASVEKVKKWGDTNINHGNSLLRIRADKYPVNWWVLTEENGTVISKSNYTCQKVKLTKNDNDLDRDIIESNVADRSKINKDEVLEIKFNDNYLTKQKNIYVWLDYADPSEKKYNDEKVKISDVTVRGKIDITPTSGRHIDASGYPEYTRAMGTIKVTSDETNHDNPETQKNNVTLKNGKWHGDYTINEIWPIIQNITTNKWEAFDNLKIKNLSMKEGDTVEIIFPAAAKKVAVSQPNRFDAEKAGKCKKDDGAGEGNYKGEDTDFNGKPYGTAETGIKAKQEGIFWCTDVTATKSTTTPTAVLTSKCTTTFKPSNGTSPAKSAYIPIIHIDESDFRTGDEK